MARPRSVSIWAWRSQGGKSSHRVYHVLLSKRFSAKKVLRLVREHWSIESVLSRTMKGGLRMN